MHSLKVRLSGRVPFLVGMCCIVAVMAGTARPAHAQTTFTAYQGWKLYTFISQANQTPGFNGTINLAGGGPSPARARPPTIPTTAPSPGRAVEAWGATAVPAAAAAPRALAGSAVARWRSRERRTSIRAPRR